MTASVSQVCATTPRLWVTSMIARPSAVAQIEQQAQHLRLHGDVERGGRLVRDQDLGPAGQRHRDHRALAHAAGEFVRIGADAARRIGDADLPQQLDGAVARVLGAGAFVKAHAFGDLVADAHDGIEVRARVLEDHADLDPAHLAHLGSR